MGRDKLLWVNSLLTSQHIWKNTLMVIYKDPKWILC